MRSYALHRPIGPFTWPSEHHDKVAEIVNWDTMQYVPEIRRSAFGYIEWTELPPMADLNRYELMVPKEQDELLPKIGRALAMMYERACESGLEGDQEQLQRSWERARDRYGYTDEQIGDAMYEFLD